MLLFTRCNRPDPKQDRDAKEKEPEEPIVLKTEPTAAKSPPVPNQATPQPLPDRSDKKAAEKPPKPASALPAAAPRMPTSPAARPAVVRKIDVPKTEMERSALSLSSNAEKYARLRAVQERLKRLFPSEPQSQHMKRAKVLSLRGS